MKNPHRYIIPETSTIKDALIALDKNSDDILTLIIVDSEGKMIGTLTDGDVRRGLIQGVSLRGNVRMVMRSSFRFISDNNREVSLIREYKKLGVKLLPYLDKEGRVEKVYALNGISSILPLDAVIMAGGKGERMRPLTLTTPKPLLKIGNKSIIDYNIDALISYGIENISVTINYLHEQIEEHFKEKRRGVKIKCIREPQFLGTIGSIKFVDSFVNDTILVMNSDLFTNIDYEDFYLHYQQNDADMSVAVIPYTINVPYGIFELSGRNIQGIKEKPIYNYYANAGVYLIKRKLLELIPSDEFYNATDYIELLITKGYKVIRFPITGYWVDIGRIEDYNKAQELVKHL